MNQPADFEIDRRAVRRNFSPSCGYRRLGIGTEPEVSSRMAERLDYIRIEPRRIIDAGCGTGMDLAELARRYPTAEIFGIDAALPAILRARPARGLLQESIRLREQTARCWPALTSSACRLPRVRHRWCGRI